MPMAECIMVRFCAPDQHGGGVMGQPVKYGIGTQL
jgi:hypothetical protein